MTTIAPTSSPNKNQKKFKAHIIFDEEYTNELANKSSKIFKELAMKVERSLDSLYSSTIHGYLYAKVESFSSGSIICDVRIFVEKSSNATVENLKKTLIKNKEKLANDTGLTVKEVDVTQIEPTELTDGDDNQRWPLWKIVAIAAGAVVFLVVIVVVILCIKVGLFVAFV